MVTDELRQQAAAGDLAAQYQLALRLYKDSGEDNNPRQGFLWMRVAAESGYLRAQKALGLLYTSAQYAPYPDENPEEAIRMYRMAAEQGDPEAQYWLGRCYLTGYGTPVQEEEGKRWISAARSRGYEEDPDLVRNEGHYAREQAEAPRREWEFSKEERRENEPDEVRAPEYGAIEPETVERGKSPAIGEAEPMARAPRFSRDYITTGLLFAVLGVLGGLLLAGVLVLLVAVFGGFAHPWVVFLVFGLIGAGVGFYAGYRYGYQRAVDRIYFRNTAFYTQVQKDFEELDRVQQSLYEICVRLQKEFQPFCYRSARLPRSPFSSYRGYMVPYMIMPGRRGMTVIDLLLVTEKAIYVINQSGLSGTVSGNGEDEEWKVQSMTGRVRFLTNPLLVNESCIQSLQDALRALCPGFWLHDIPIYSVVVFGSHTSIDKVENVPHDENKYILSGSGEKVRSFVEMQESKHSLRTREMTEVMKAVEHLLKQYPEYKHQAGKQHAL